MSLDHATQEKVRQIVGRLAASLEQITAALERATRALDEIAPLLPDDNDPERCEGRK